MSSRKWKVRFRGTDSVGTYPGVNAGALRSGMRINLNNGPGNGLLARDHSLPDVTRTLRVEILITP